MAIDLVWAAGFFDGEGCIRISAATGRNHHALAVEVSNTDEDLLRPFLRWGGQLRPATGLRPDQRQAFVWRCWSRKALVFLEAIRPYVQSSKNQDRIALAVEFQGLARFGRHGSDPAHKAKRRDCYERMRALNVRGRS